MNLKIPKGLNLLAFKNVFFAISAITLTAGMIFLGIWGLNLGIDFTGGTLWEVKFERKPNQEEFLKIFQENKLEIISLQSSENSYLIRTKVIPQEVRQKVFVNLTEKFGQVEDARFETIGPTISVDLQRKAVIALVAATVAILAFIAWSFRKVPKPATSFSFAICAVLALMHDVLVLLGSFAILGKIGATIDSLFVTAALTVIGFSVHDTIVVFDRIRENLTKLSKNLAFDEIVNFSILQTLGRSLATSLTVIFVLVALLLFGGEGLRWFVVALLIGIISGTYSSIFTAAPLLVVWQTWVSKVKS